LHAQAGPLQTPAAVAAATTAGFDVQPQQQQQQQQQQSLRELEVVYRRFLENSLVKEFHRMSRSLPDIQCQAAALWPKYLSGAAAKQQQQQRADDAVSLSCDTQQYRASYLPRWQSGSEQATITSLSFLSCVVVLLVCRETGTSIRNPSCTQQYRASCAQP
jgi:hypothetical protein